jgi:predicted transcriptional regulator
MPEENESVDTVELATALTVAWLSNGHARATADDVLAFLRSMHEAVTGLVGGNAPATAEEQTSYEGAVTVRKSLASPDHILSMIDGKPYKALKRHLSTNGLTPDEYRARYNLKADYPMTAPTYSAARSEMAKRIGLGSKGRKAKPATAQPAKAAKK